MAEWNLWENRVGVAGGRWPRLWAASGAVLAAVLLLVAVRFGVGSRLPARLPFYAANSMSFKVNGVALQEAAFRAPRELPVYGSSELDRHTSHRADAFFRLEPSGFAVFPVGRGGTTCLLLLQKLAAVGEAARGQRVVLFLSPTWFLQPGVEAAAVGTNLGMVQLNAWIFDGELDATLRTALARRMLSYRSALQNETLISAALRCLAFPTPGHRLLFWLLTPLGKTQDMVLRWCDSGVLLWEMVFTQARWNLPESYFRDAQPATGLPIAWDRLVGAAACSGQAGREIPAQEAPVAQDRSSLARLGASQEFGDLALLLRVLRALDMRALFIGQPFDVAATAAGQVSAGVRRAYYERLRAMIRSAGFSLQSFEEHGDDPAFFEDPLHPSARAWLFYDRAIDEWYHASVNAPKVGPVPETGGAGSAAAAQR